MGHGRSIYRRHRRYTESIEMHAQGRQNPIVVSGSHIFLFSFSAVQQSIVYEWSLSFLKEKTFVFFVKLQIGYASAFNT